AADQFSFCVALYVALCGRWPFAGAPDSDQFRESARAGRLREPPRQTRTPRWVLTALGRGLQPEPDARYPDMDALLAVLDRDRARPRRQAALATALIAVLGLSVYALARQPSSAVEMCSGGPAAVAAVWNEDKRTELSGALAAIATPYADAVAPHVADQLDRYGQAWAATHRDTCLAHQRGERSTELFDRGMRCLDTRLHAMASAVAVLADMDASSVTRARDVVGDLPSVASCDDLEALAATVARPTDADTRRQVDALSQQLGRARALESAGRYPDALTEIRSVLEGAEPLDYPPLTAEALLARGRVALVRLDFAEAVAPLEKAGEIALSHGMWAMAVEAAARRFYVQSMRDRDSDVPLGEFALIEALSQHGAARGFARLLLLNNIGVAHMSRGQRAQARSYFRRAMTELGDVTADHRELASIARNLSMVTRDPIEREALAARATAQVDRTVGERHPLALHSRVAQAHYTLDLDRARVLLETACAGYRTFHPDQVTARVQALYYLGFVRAELGDREGAADPLERAAELGDSDALRVWQHLARGFASHYRGQHEAALPHFAAALAALPDPADSWWLRERAAHARLGLGMAQRALGRPAAAVAELDRARAIFAQL
ncbi:MAG: hypothetical protein AAGC55_21370, partial [Myxococcota bacterium]